METLTPVGAMPGGARRGPVPAPAPARGRWGPSSSPAPNPPAPSPLPEETDRRAMDGTRCPPGTRSVAAVGVSISAAPLFGLAIVRTLRPVLLIAPPSRGEFSSWEPAVAAPAMATVSTVLVRRGPGGRDEARAGAAVPCLPGPGPEPRSGLFSLLPSASAPVVAAAMLRVTTPGDDGEAADDGSLFDGESAEEEGGTRAS